MGIQMPTKDVYTISGTGFSMEIRMVSENVYEILGTAFIGDKNAHSEYQMLD
jgi:hypothetical protein